MAEGDTILEPAKTKPELTKISRRGLLKGIVGTGLGLAIGQVPESPSLEKQIEGRFGIIIFTDNKPPTPAVTLISSDGTPQPYKIPPEVKWNNAQLSLLADVLENLPKSFYEPKTASNSKKLPLKIGLNRGAREFSGRCICWSSITESGRNPSVVLGIGSINLSRPNEIRLSKQIVVHELTHYVAGDKIDELKESIAAKIGLLSEEDLNQRFDSKDWSDSDELVADDKNTMKYGGRNFDEFFSVASSFYTEGEKKFYSLYVPVLEKDKTSILYQGLKDNLFQGNEYKNFVLQNKP